jgi:serine phosphatase RsbU (regulator of sigma subunit)
MWRPIVNDLDTIPTGVASSLRSDLSRLLPPQISQPALPQTRWPVADPCDNVYAQELEIARGIQQSLLPKKFPVLPGFGLSGFCLSSRQVGGDFYDVLPLSGHSALLVIADVMGKGVPAALFAATLRGFIRTMADGKPPRPGQLLTRINRLMFEELSSVDMFITAQVALLDANKPRIVVASAGHCPLLLSTPAGVTTFIAPDGVPLGILPEFTFSEETVKPSGCALLYTDGLLEAANPAGELFGRERLARWLGATSKQNQTASERSADLVGELQRFQSRPVPSDDQAFLILAAQR